MPRYIYACWACNEEFEINHGMFHEQRHCVLCKRVDTLTKVPAFTIKKQTERQEAPVGQVVDEFIKEAKKDLKQQKKELKSEER